MTEHQAGHNSSISADQLRSIIERVERLEEEKRGIADDIKDIYAEARGNGFDAKAIRKIVAMRRMDADKRREEEAILDVYLAALGMLVDTPLGRAAVARDFP
jgi:uncharacterized protein (UPF0335 family)